VCFDLDSAPPIRPLFGAAVEAKSLTLHSADGANFRAFHARPATPTGKAIIILPDTRGLHHYYEELAQRFAEIGVEAVAIDYFGRTAGVGARDEQFEYMPQVAQPTWAGLSADFKAAAEYLRSGADKPNAAVPRPDMPLPSAASPAPPLAAAVPISPPPKSDALSGTTQNAQATGSGTAGSGTNDSGVAGLSAQSLDDQLE